MGPRLRSPTHTAVAPPAPGSFTANCHHQQVSSSASLVPHMLEGQHFATAHVEILSVSRPVEQAFLLLLILQVTEV